MRHPRGPSRKKDPGFIGATVHVSGTFNPSRLAAVLALPFERPPALRVRGRSKFAIQLAPSSNSNYLKLIIAKATSCEDAAARLCSSLDRMPDKGTAAWLKAESRTLDLGISSRNRAAVCTYELSDGVLRRLADWRISLMISWYWPSAD